MRQVRRPRHVPATACCDVPLVADDELEFDNQIGRRKNIRWEEDKEPKSNGKQAQKRREPQNLHVIVI